MSLTDRIVNVKGGSSKGLPCSVGVLLRTLSGDDLSELEALLADPSVEHTALERAIRAEGHHVGVGTVGKHRRDDCRCSK